MVNVANENKDQSLPITKKWAAVFTGLLWPLIGIDFLILMFGPERSPGMTLKLILFPAIYIFLAVPVALYARSAPKPKTAPLPPQMPLQRGRGAQPQRR